MTSNHDLLALFRLSDKQLRGRGLFLTESPLVTQRAVESGIAVEAILCREGTEIPEAVLRNQPSVFAASEESLREFTGFSLTRGMMSLCRLPQLPDAAELLKELSLRQTLCPRQRIAVLYNIVDAVNVGTIFRSAAALGIDAILLSPSCCHPLNRRASRVSMGNVFKLPWAFIDDLSLLSATGFNSAAMALTADSITPEELSRMEIDKLAIILGNEGEGLPKEVIAASDYTVCIPMAKDVDSLNVAAAAAIAFYATSPTR